MSKLSRALLSVGVAGLFPLVTPVVAADQLVAVSVDGALRASGSSFVDLVEDALRQVGRHAEAVSQYQVAVELGDEGASAKLSAVLAHLEKGEDTVDKEQPY